MGALAKRCLYCGTAAAGEAAAAKARPVACVCPGCARTVRVMPGAPAACMYCALPFTASSDPAQPPRLGPAHGGVSRAQVAALTAALPPARLWQTVRELLPARADREELVPGEAEAVLRRLAAILDHPAGDAAAWLPLELEEAEQLVARVVFGHVDFGVTRETGRSIVTVVLASRDRSNLPVHGKHLATDALGFALDRAIGIGFRADRTDEVRGQTRVQLRVELAPAHGGVALAFADQIDQDPPTPVSAAARDEIARRLGAARDRLLGYYLLTALYGSACRGAIAFNLVRDAIAARMAALACPVSPQLLDVLCLRMPAPYAPP